MHIASIQTTLFFFGKRKARSAFSRFVVTWKGLPFSVIEEVTVASPHTYESASYSRPPSESFVNGNLDTVHLTFLCFWPGRIVAREHPTEEACVDCAPSSVPREVFSLLSPPSQLASATASSSTATSSAEPQSTECQDIQPPEVLKPAIIIEFCDRCRWAPRASWIQTELFLTFPIPLLRSITLQPLNAPETGGRFRVWLDRGNGWELCWCRKKEGGFPELKVLKQRIRNLIQPDMSLGHSDVHGKHKAAVSATTNPSAANVASGTAGSDHASAV